jgi:hypothetical protein
MTLQIVQLAGALLVLAGFLAAQADLVDQRSYRYLLANGAGSAALAVTAAVGGEWGFLFLEGAWALVSFRGLGERFRDRASAR